MRGSALALGGQGRAVAHGALPHEAKRVGSQARLADGRGVHSVFVDGRRVVENYRCTLIDEDRLLAEAQVRAERIVERSGLSPASRWPVA